MSDEVISEAAREDGRTAMSHDGLSGTADGQIGDAR